MDSCACINSADLTQLSELIDLLMVDRDSSSIFALINRAAFFETLSMLDTTPADKQRDLSVNLTASFLHNQNLPN